MPSGTHGETTMPVRKMPEGLANALSRGAASYREIAAFVAAPKRGRRLRPGAAAETAASAETAVPEDLSNLVKGFWVEAFNASAHARRDGIFDTVRNAPGYNGPIVTAIGDSWFCYPIELTDVIANLERRIAIRNRSWAGYSLRRHVDFSALTYEGSLQMDRPGVVFMSVGGNDLIGGGALADYLIRGRPSDPASYLGRRFADKLEETLGLYRQVVDFVRSVRGDAKIVVHGYDHAVPRPGGRWFGKPMDQAGVPGDIVLRTGIVRVIVDRWYDKLAALRRARPRNVTVLDMRGVVAGEWFDELHPSDPAFKRVADRFAAEL